MVHTARSELALDDLFELLANERRRRVLEHVRGADGPTGLPQLAADIAKRESDGIVDSASPSEVERVQASLHHQHVPKLAESDVVDRGPDGETVSSGANVADAARLLDAVDRVPSVASN
ncbi:MULTISPECIES: DUF7344 domain-containing protein [Halorussus]|uniref:DUF7344 domain-containing protein n=1 Tax=Halorussus TaxID=1070314 RepID=UPI00209D8450|nr:hypothetical protein [Halorussus vallis]USZ74825.1 hypothetical protein NGM07_15450 [Halorussus vallis]